MSSTTLGPRVAVELEPIVCVMKIKGSIKNCYRLIWFSLYITVTLNIYTRKNIMGGTQVKHAE